MRLCDGFRRIRLEQEQPAGIGCKIFALKKNILHLLKNSFLCFHLPSMPDPGNLGYRERLPEIMLPPEIPQRFLIRFRKLPVHLQGILQLKLRLLTFLAHLHLIRLPALRQINLPPVILSRQFTAQLVNRFPVPVYQKYPS